MGDVYFIEIENFENDCKFEHRKINLQGRAGSYVKKILFSVYRDNALYSQSDVNVKNGKFETEFNLRNGNYEFIVNGFNSNNDARVSKKYGIEVNELKREETAKPHKENIFDNVIVLEVGHGGREFGAKSKYTPLTEWHLNWIAAKSCARTLKEMGFKDVLITDDNSGLFGVGYKFAKLADLFVSIHHNAFNEEAQGCECLYSPKGNYGDKKLADLIAGNLSDELDLPNRQGKSQGLSILSGATRARFEGQDHRGLDAAVLAECYFMDAKISNYEDYSSRSGEAIAKSICEFFEM